MNAAGWVVAGRTPRWSVTVSAVLAVESVFSGDTGDVVGSMVSTHCREPRER
jgi:hypothetical protein